MIDEASQGVRGGASDEGYGSEDMLKTLERDG